MTGSTASQERVGPRARWARLRRIMASRGLRGGTASGRLPARAEEILSSIFNVASEGVIVADADLRVALFSKGAQAIFGYSEREVIGRPIEHLLPAEHRAGHRAHTARFADGAQQTRKMTSRNGIVGLRKDGTTVPLEVGLSRLSTRDGTIFTAIVRDLTERKQAEAALELAADEAQAANRAKSAFLAAMSHEIRTPLNGVLGMAQAMEADERDPKKVHRLKVIRQSGEALLGILNDLLDLSKIEAGRLELEETEFDLEEVVLGAHAVFSGLAAGKGLSLELTLSRNAKGVYRGDPLRVRQILHNLISNAVKFTETGGVRISVRRDATGVLQIAVRDTGVGVSPEQASRLFQKFTQADASVSRRFGGTGLGLSICRELAEMMGGEIGVRSRLGHGAVFEVKLPLVWVGAARPKAEASLANAAELSRGLRILVAEDNPTNQLVLKTLLEQFGFETTMVEDGAAAVRAWERGDWDLILMDVQMPGVDGLTATGIIRGREAAEARTATPIYALTANAMKHQAAEYRRAGMDGLIAKPIEVAELLQAIGEAQAKAAARLAPAAETSGRAVVG